MFVGQISVWEPLAFLTGHSSSCTSPTPTQIPTIKTVTKPTIPLIYYLHNTSSCTEFLKRSSTNPTSPPPKQSHTRQVINTLTTMADCTRCQQQNDKTNPEDTTRMETKENPTWPSQSDGIAITSDYCMPADDVKLFETMFYEKMNAAHLRNVPKGALTELQARARGGEQSKTADLLLHILWNPMNRQKIIPGCPHQYKDFVKLIDELVALYGPRSDG